MLSITLEFLNELKDNNNKLWFDEHKPRFEKAKAEFAVFVDRMANEIAAFDESIDGQTAKTSIYRIYRDVRFSNDKTPYKSHFGAFLAGKGKKSNGPGYYIHIEPNGKSMVGGGMYMPEAVDLQKIRQEIDYSGDKLKQLIETSHFKKFYPGLWEEGKLSRPPKGYEATNPNIEFLKLKSFIVSHPLKDNELKEQKLIAHTTAAFKELFELNKFLKEALS